ncbi:MULTISPECIES: tyrosine-type recombinase/integrase [Parasphingorhabdus]|nr:site-specific integrase [Parasphingorhabdus halotolerans]
MTWDIELPGFGLRKRSNGKVTWVVKYRYRGQQRMKTLGAARAVPAHIARAEARKLIAEAALVGLPTKPKQKYVPRFDEYVHEFWRDYAQHWKPTTQKACQGYIARELVPVFGKMQIDQIERVDINRWRDALSKRTGVFNRTIPLMSVMMRYAEQLGHRPKGTNPCRGVSRYKRDLPERYLSPIEYKRLGRVLADSELPNPDVVPAILMLLYTGARASEIETLRWRYIQIPRLVLPDSKTGPKTIYLNRQAVDVLNALEQGKPDDFVFQATRSGDPINLSQYWHKIRKRAALPDVRLHDLRHSFASTAIADGIPLAIIGKLLGHALPESTARYAHLADDVICESAERVCSGLASQMGISHDQL